MNKFKKAATLVLSMSMALAGFASCGGTEIEGEGGGGSPISVEKIDKSKTQLYVLNYNGGIGHDWLTSVKQEFERMYADWEGDDGKVGVQIYIDNTKQNCTGAAITNASITSRDEVWFTDQAYYYNLLDNNVFADMTPAVTGSLSKYGDSRTIEDKLNANQKDYYNVDGKYYGIPHYSSYPVITYDKDLFTQEKLYFAYDEEDSDEGFIASKNAKKSVGLDGIEGTEDDGLPVTFADWEKLCARMVSRNVEPFLWSGKAVDTYLPYLPLAFRVCYDGLNTENLRYSFDGNVTGLVDVDSNGNVTPYNGTGAATITNENGYLMNKTAGMYYGISFLEKIFKNKWYSNDCTNLNITHLEAQQLYVMSSINPDVTKPIAMFIDGSWWECEAETAFADSVSYFGEQNSKQNRNFGIMPLPSRDNGKQTYVDYSYSLCFINRYAVENVSDKKMNLIYDFIKYAYCDNSLVDFSVQTGTPRGVNYTIPAAKMANLSPYAKQLINLKLNSDIVYPYSSTDFFKKNSTIMKPMETSMTMNSLVDGDLYTSEYGAFYRNAKKVTAIQYFNGLTEYWTDNNNYNYRSLFNF